LKNSNKKVKNIKLYSLAYIDDATVFERHYFASAFASDFSVQGESRRRFGSLQGVAIFFQDSPEPTEESQRLRNAFISFRSRVLGITRGF
jgi:hypothetical protein